MKIKRIKNENNFLAYCLIAPWIIGFLMLFAIPMVSSLYISFTSYNLLSPPEFLGIDNYKRLWEDRDFWNSLKVTVHYVAVLVPFRLTVALAIALLLAQSRKLSGFYRTIYYIPSVIGGSVAVAIIWKQLFGNPGVVMTLLKSIGYEMELSLIGNSKTAIYILILLGVWQFGSSMLIFLAALKQVPKTYYEAASIEGANAPQHFWHITLPMITPTIFFNLLLQIISGFKVFNSGYIITSGGPSKSTMFYVLNLYNRAFKYLEMGYSSALAWVLVLIIGVITAIVFLTQNKWVYYEAKEGK